MKELCMAKFQHVDLVTLDIELKVLGQKNEVKRYAFKKNL